MAVQGNMRDAGQERPERGRLLSRPGALTEPGERGEQPLGLAEGRDGLIYVPARYQADHPAPLVLMLHGAGGSAPHALAPFLSTADRTGFILLAPDSRGQTWDFIRGGYGPDVAFIDRALAQTFSRYAIDRAHIAIEGFSDGASCALSLGVTNGDLFTHIIAFSPGFMAPPAQRGRPRVFISHGTLDNVLPIDRCSRRIVPALQRIGYNVCYEEYPGFHMVPAKIAREAMQWFQGKEDAARRESARQAR